MATYRIPVFTILLLLSTVNAKPIDSVNDTPYEVDPANVDASQSLNESENPDLYLIVAEAVDDSEDSITPLDRDEDGAGNVEKRSAESEVDDLETAAGTNVLRPLFVYRQQVAYRERVKKGIRRSGFRPRF